MSSNKSIAKSAGIIGAATLLSRVLGFVRDMIFAAFFGTGVYAQAFVVAFRIPNLFRDLIGEGAANAAVVPVLVEELTHKGEKEFWRLSNILLNITLVILTAMTVAGFIFARPITVAMAFGFLDDPAKLDITTALTRILFPYLILIGLAAYGMGVLNSIKHFAAPALGMSLLNISMIVCMFIWRQDVVGLVTGVLLGGCLQIIIQIPPLLKKGIVFNETRLFHPQIKKIARLLIPRVFGAGVYHINVVIGTQLASIERIVGEGAVAALYFSSRIWQLPLAIFPIALAQAALPTLSSHIAARQADKFRSSINFLLRSVSFLMLPASAGLIALSFPITRVLFQRGEFGAYSTQITSYALLFYSIGLFSYGVIKILVNAFYSMQDTKTPVKVATLSLGVNVILSIMLMFRLRVGGIALANSVSGIFNAAMLYIILKRKIGAFDGKGLLGSFFRILAASVLMGIFVFLLNRHLVLFFSTPKTAYLAAALIISMAAGILFYIIVCHILQIEELKELRIWLLKKR